MRETEQISPHDLETLRRDRAPRGGVALLVYHRDEVKHVQLSSDRPLVIGRDPREPGGLAISDPSLSREHARFTLRGDVVTVEDLESRNGTWLRGERVTRVDVAHGDEIRLSALPVRIHGELGPRSFRRPLSHEGFRVALEDEVVRARHFRRPLALLMFRAVGQHVSSFHALVTERLRAVDRIALYSPDTLELLLPEGGPAEARQVAETVVALSRECVPGLTVGVATHPEAASEAEALLAECRKALLAPGEVARIRVAARSPRVAKRRGRAAGDADAVVVASDAMRRVVDNVAMLAHSSIPVLILGETGVGKEIVAQRIHAQSARQGKPLIVVNCAAIPETLVEATLFGHERGAFTGAAHQKTGLFEAADGGTLLLDEIGDLPKPSQAAVLRVLDRGRVLRVGATEEIDVDVRILAATHRDLEAMCEDGAFRSDLLYRLSGVTVSVPPLRDRIDDLEPLTASLLARANELNGRSVAGVTPEAMALIKAYPWPGNVRELRNAVERAVVLTRSDRITPEDLPERVVMNADAARATMRSEVPRAAGSAASTAAQPAPPTEASPSTAAPVEGAGSLKDQVASYEADLIVAALNATGGNQRQAAKRLGLPLRTLVHKMGTHRIKRPPYK